MKKILLFALTSLSILTTNTFAGDYDSSRRDLRRAKEYVSDAIDLLSRARNDDRLDKDGHGETALNLLRTARSEIEDAQKKIKNRKD